MRIKTIEFLIWPKIPDPQKSGSTTLNKTSGIPIHVPKTRNAPDIRPANAAFFISGIRPDTEFDLLATRPVIRLIGR
jgi:hypothetical protein